MNEISSLPRRFTYFALTSAVGCAVLPALAQQHEPYQRLREQSSAFKAPPSETLSPSQVREVLIAYFGPSDGQDPAAGSMWQAAQVAIAEANQQGGLEGVPFRLISAWSKDPWGTGVADLARLAYRERVWAIVGGIDGPSTHLAEQIVSKARLPLVSPVSTDKSANLANVPWLYSLAPGDHLIAPALAAWIAQHVGQQSWVLVTSDEHDARQLAEDVKASVATHRLGPEFQFVYRSSAPDFRAIVARTIARQPVGVVMLGTSGDSAAFVRLLRSEEYGGPVVGGPWMGRSQFLEQAGAAAEGVVFPLLAARCQLEPKDVSAGQSATVPADADSWDYAACLTYDAVRLVIEAIRRGGLNRDRIRTTIHSLQPWAGISGTVRWDPLGSNMREIQLATVKNGRIRPLSDTACDLP